MYDGRVTGSVSAMAAHARLEAPGNKIRERYIFIYLFIVYLTVLSVAQSMPNVKAISIVNNDVKGSVHGLN
jgi:hypothetical protein